MNIVYDLVLIDVIFSNLSPATVLGLDNQYVAVLGSPVYDGLPANMTQYSRITLVMAIS